MGGHEKLELRFNIEEERLLDNDPATMDVEITEQELLVSTKKARWDICLQQERITYDFRLAEPPLPLFKRLDEPASDEDLGLLDDEESESEQLDSSTVDPEPDKKPTKPTQLRKPSKPKKDDRVSEV